MPRIVFCGTHSEQVIKNVATHLQTDPDKDLIVIETIPSSVRTLSDKDASYVQVFAIDIKDAERIGKYINTLTSLLVECHELEIVIAE